MEGIFANELVHDLNEEVRDFHNQMIHINSQQKPSP